MSEVVNGSEKGMATVIKALLQGAQFSPEHFMPQFLYSSDRFRVVFLCLEAGQEVPHHASGDASFYVVGGQGIITLGQEEHPVAAGDLIVCPGGLSHSVKGVEKLALLVSVAQE